MIDLGPQKGPACPGRIRAQNRQIQRLLSEYPDVLPECAECRQRSILAGERRWCWPCTKAECDKAGVLVGVWD